MDKNQTAVNTDNFQAQFIENDVTTGGKMKDSTTLTYYGPISVCPAAGPTVVKIDFDGAGTKPSLCLKQQSGPVSLTPGQRVIIYFKISDGILSSVDSGLPTNVGIFASKTGAPITTTISNL